MLGMYLYLAAYEEGASEGAAPPCEEALLGLKKAWVLACAHKERSLAEYIFEKMEPYLSSDEVALYAGELQDLALDKLEEFGLDRDDLEGIAEMIAEDFLSGSSAIMRVEHVIEHSQDSDDEEEEAAADEDSDDASFAPGCPLREAQAHGAAAALPKPPMCGVPAAGTSSSSDAGDKVSANNARGLGQPEPGKPSRGKVSPPQSVNPMDIFAQAISESGAKSDEMKHLDYDSVSGYGAVIDIMHDLGIGLRNRESEQFQGLVNVLNARHGLDRVPALDTLLFRAPVHEDANCFVMATLGELDLPVLRMSMEESLQGMPVLCVAAQAENAPKLNSMRNAFEGGGVLVLEDIDMWACPFPEDSDEPGNFLMMQLSRGAREAVNLIRSAVENPDVYVFVTTSTSMEIDPFFLDLLEPLSFVDIDYPTPEERVEIWMDIVHDHPSLRSINRTDLVRLSSNMSRFDIYMAAREAVEEAYKAGLSSRSYRPVTRDNIFDKLAAYQPLESREYHELEDEILRDFRSDLGHIDDLLDDE